MVEGSFKDLQKYKKTFVREIKLTVLTEKPFISFKIRISVILKQNALLCNIELLHK